MGQPQKWDTSYTVEAENLCSVQPSVSDLCNMPWFSAKFKEKPRRQRTQSEIVFRLLAEFFLFFTFSFFTWIYISVQRVARHGTFPSWVFILNVLAAQQRSWGAMCNVQRATLCSESVKNSTARGVSRCLWALARYQMYLLLLLLLLLTHSWTAGQRPRRQLAVTKLTQQTPVVDIDNIIRRQPASRTHTHTQTHSQIKKILAYLSDTRIFIDVALVLSVNCGSALKMFCCV